MEHFLLTSDGTVGTHETSGTVQRNRDGAVEDRRRGQRDLRSL
jgi:hypothetical protein